MKKSGIIVRLPNWLGDAVMCEPAIRRLQDAFPQSPLVYLGRPGVVSLFKQPGSEEAVWSCEGNKKNSLSLRQLREKVQENGIESGIIFPNSFSSARMMYRARVRERCGYKRNYRHRYLTHPVKVLPTLKELHQVLYYGYLVDQFIGDDNGLSTQPDFITPVPSPKIEIFPAEQQWAMDFLKQYGWEEDQPLVGMSPGAQNSRAKQWWPDRFAAVAQWLTREKNCKAILFGSSEEKQLANRIELSSEISLINAVGKTDLRQLAALFERCSTFLTNDNGAMHLAAAAGVRVVALFGPTIAANTAPVGAQHVLLREPVECSPCMLRDCPIDHRCMDRITVQKVKETLEEILQPCFFLSV